MSDVFFFSPWRGETRYTDVFIQGSGGWESRQLRINLSYNFGRNTNNRPRTRETGIESEIERID
ncbi:MAG: hypothetical protein LAT67_14745 [Balneolales bacterium]|nr:hypothetical protein [Balneolales bacterium]